MKFSGKYLLPFIVLAQPVLAKAELIPLKIRREKVNFYELVDCVKYKTDLSGKTCSIELAPSPGMPKGTDLTVDFKKVVMPGYKVEGKKVTWYSHPLIAVSSIDQLPSELPADSKDVIPSAKVIESLKKKKLYISYVDIENHELVRRHDNRPRPTTLPAVDYVFRWDLHNPSGLWAASIAKTLHAKHPLMDKNNMKDLSDFCPRFATDKKFTDTEKRIFWIGLVNEIAYRESLFTPMVANDEGIFSEKNKGVVSRGHMQMSYSSLQRESYRNQGCSKEILKKESDLNDPVINHRCALAIFSSLILRDGCISCQTETGAAKGPSLYWSTLRAPYKINCGESCGGTIDLGKRQKIIDSLKQRIPLCFPVEQQN